MGKYQGRLAADAILGKNVAVVSDGPLSPRVIFSDPQVAAVGHTVASAEAAGLVVRAVDVETGGTAGASFVGRGAPGTSRLVIDETRGVIVGATFTGVEVASGCTRPRSRSSARCRWSASSTPSRPSRRAARSG